jgi:four helix bundle protein
MATGVDNLLAFRKSFDLAMKIYELSKEFPKEEKYSLTDQIRRSSRAVSANLAEAYCKRRYVAHFISKLSDSDMENTETQVWLKFSLKCAYLSNNHYDELIEESKSIGKLLDYMMRNPAKFSRQDY